MFPEDVESYPQLPQEPVDNQEQPSQSQSPMEDLPPMDEMEPQGNLPLEQQEEQPSPFDDIEMEIDTTDMLEDIVKQYIEHASEIRNDYALNAQVKSKVLLDMAQSLSYLVPLVPSLNIETKNNQEEMMMREKENEQKIVHTQEMHEMKLQQQREQFELDKLKQRSEDSKKVNE